MVARSLVLTVLLAGVPAFAGAQSTNTTPPATQTDSQSPEDSSSSVHHKTRANSGQKVHHTTVAEEEETPPELTKAEDFIQKQDYAAAEPLLRKVTSEDATNYVAWFELGFVENGLGRKDDSIAAYRKSVAAKPGVFESNLNLGLQLAKAGQPDAEQYLRAATQLKPTSHMAEGQARAWLSLGHVLEATKPDEAVAAYRQAANAAAEGSGALFVCGACCWKSRTTLPTRSTNTSRRWRWGRPATR